MILKRLNVEIHTDDAKMIAELKAEGYSEIKVEVASHVDGKPKGKRTRKTAKTHTK